MSSYTPNKYSLGYKKPKAFYKYHPVKSLESHEIICFVDAEWSNGVMGKKRLKLINEVFDFYYEVMQCINKGGKLSGRKKELVIDALTDGHGFGINDLNELFDHLNNNNGDWIDTTNLVKYRYSFLSERNIDLPEPIKHFADSISTTMLKMNKEVTLIGQILANISGNNLGETLKEVIDRSKKIEHLVLIDRIMNSDHRKITDTVGRAFGKVGTFTKVLSLLDTYLMDYKRAKKYNSRNEYGAVAYPSLTAALGLIPVLGEYYSNMLRFMPEAGDFMKKMLNINRTRMRQILPSQAVYYQDL